MFNECLKTDGVELSLLHQNYYSFADVVKDLRFEDKDLQSEDL